MKTSQDQLINTLVFVLNDDNTALDYEARRIIELTIEAAQLIGPTLNNFRPVIYDWVTQCNWLDAETPEEMTEALDSMSDKRLIAGLNRHYAGGFIQFIKDSQLN